MKQQYIDISQKGFITAATVILMMASLGVVVTILYRATQGAALVSSLKQSNQSYQLSDNAVEKALQNLQSLENTSQPTVLGIVAAKKIPQNILANTFCVVAAAVSCYHDDGTGNSVKVLPTDTVTTLSEVTRMSSEGVAVLGAPTRSLQVSVPERIPLPLTAITASVSGTNIIVGWSPAIIDPNAAGIKAIDPLAGIEVRRAVITLAQYNADIATNPNALSDILKDQSLIWTVVGVRQPLSASSMTDLTVPSGLYAYTLKVINKNPLMMDSLYILPVRIQK